MDLKIHNSADFEILEAFLTCLESASRKLIDFWSIQGGNILTADREPRAGSCLPLDLVWCDGLAMAAGSAMDDGALSELGDGSSEPASAIYNTNQNGHSPSPSKFIIVSMGRLTDRMGSVPILRVKRTVTTGTMLYFEGDGDGDGTCRF